jgi:MHS family proline/betaine transporter-like MFS transporter
MSNSMSEARVVTSPVAGARRAVIAASVGTVIEGYDLLLYGYLAGVLATRFFPTDDPTAALLNTFAIYAVGFAVRPIGGVLFGHIGDRAGRRTALVASMLLMAAGTLGIGLLPTYGSIGIWAPVSLLICRLVQGVAIAGEYVGANILILEHAAAGRSGRAVSANQVAVYIGVAAAAATSLLLASALTPAQLAAWGWRVPFLAAVPLALVGLYMRASVPDSPALHTPDTTRPRFPLVMALRTVKRGIAVFAGWLVMVTLGGYLLFGYLPTYLTRVVGVATTVAFGANLAAVFALAVGAVAGGHLVDRFPPRTVASASAVGVAVSVVPGFLLIEQGTFATAVLGQAIWAVGIGVGATVSALLSASQFPVPVRFAATGLAYNATVTVFGGTAPYVSTWLISRTHDPVAPAWYLAGAAVLGLVTVMVGWRPLSNEG